MPDIKPTGTILDRIVADVARRQEAAKARRPLTLVEAEAKIAPPVRGILPAIASAVQPFIIAEIKKASPSRGLLSSNFDPARIAKAYQQGGAGAISVLTEQDHFQGSLDDLRAVRGVATLPLIRKDFIIDGYQIAEGRAAGADFFLLLAVLHDANALRRLMDVGKKWGMTALVEVHTEMEMRTAIAAGSQLIGINNRDLKTFDTQLEVFERLAPLAPPDIPLIAESGIFTRADIQRLAGAGAKGYLVGESLMKSADPAASLSALRGQ